MSEKGNSDMADTSARKAGTETATDTTPREAANTAVPQQGDHDRVAMLSLKADGTPDQHNPEVIIDEEDAVRAAKTQFSQQAVSALDVQQQGASATGAVTLVGQEDGTVTEEPLRSDIDPSVQARKEEQDKVAKSAESAAESAVSSLIRDKKQ